MDTIETPDGKVIMVPERRRLPRIKSAIKRGRIADIGKFKTYKKEIDLNTDRKRFWPWRLKTVHSDLCVCSMPHDVNTSGRMYAKESGLTFYTPQEEYRPYDEY